MFALLRYPATCPLTLTPATPPRAAAPKTLKIFVNRDNMSFDDVDSFPPTQTIELQPNDYVDGTAKVALQYVKFQSCQSITIFVQDNLEGSEVTCLSRLHFRGSAIQATNVNELKKQPNVD